MRPKVVLAILLAAGLFVGMTFLLKSNKPAAASAPVAAAAPVPVAQSAPIVAPPPPPTPAPATVVQTQTPEEKAAAIQAEKDRLTHLEWYNDPQSLSNILADLNSPEKEIRMAAIQAAVQFGSTNAIPVLMQAYTNASDFDEKVALHNAADYLALPAVAFTPGSGQLTPEQQQAAQQQQAAYEARKQARMQQLQNAQPGQGMLAPGQ